MAYDEGLAERIRSCFDGRNDVEEKKMFGGLCFMVSQHMCCGIIGDSLMARVGPNNYDACLRMEHVSEMDFTGRALKRMVYIATQGVDSDSDLQHWVDSCTEFVHSLPAKSTG